MKNPSWDEPFSGPREKPWVTGFLLHQVVRYMKEKIPGDQLERICRETLKAVKGFEHIQNPEAFLTDPNHWLPQKMLQFLLRKCEEISGDPEIAYKAALHHFSPGADRTFSALETVATLLGDMKTVFLCAPLWASVYSNQYLRLQPFCIPGASSSIGLIAQFQPQVKSIWGNHLLVRGNCEGFGKMYDFIESVSSEESFIQVRLEDFVEEFPGYRLGMKGNNKIVFDRNSGQTVLEAFPVTLTEETVPSLPGLEEFSRDLLIFPVQNGSIKIPAYQPGAKIERGRHTAYRIAGGGVLQKPGVSLQLKKGLILNAPFTRFRFHWKESSLPREKPKAIPLKKVTHFIFNHLQELRTYHQKLLGMFIENAALSRENRDLKQEATHKVRYMGFVGTSRPMQELYSMIKAVAPIDATVLINGETGTGKELVARALHDQGPRNKGRFMALNCGALSEHLLESELFGHERGAFTGAVNQKKGKFELAHQGTLFLDEIGEISPAVQIKLLRVLQERNFQRVGGSEDIQVDVRIIAATNEDLEALVKKRRFRKDLFYRLHVIPIHLPPLRERLEDIPLLVEYFIQKTRIRLPHRVHRPTPETIECLTAHDWPGNVRELENVVERGVALAGEKTVLDVDLLPGHLRKKNLEKPSALEDLFEQMDWNHISQFIGKRGNLESLVSRFEWRIVQEAIQGHGGNKSQAARALNRSYRWIRKLEQRREQEGSV